MKEAISARYARRLPVALFAGAVLFFWVGPAAIEALTDFGFGWSRSGMQDVALVAAWLISAPGDWIVEFSDPPRFLLAVNGAIWGGLLYSAWTLMVAIGHRLRRQS